MAVSFPYLIALASILVGAILAPLAKKTGLMIPPFTFICCSSFLLFLWSAIVVVFFEKDKLVLALPTIDWRWLLCFAALHFVSYILYLGALTRIPVAHYQMFGLLSPVVGGIIAYFLFKEPFEPRYFVALALIGTGLYVAIQPKF